MVLGQAQSSPFFAMTGYSVRINKTCDFHLIKESGQKTTSLLNKCMYPFLVGDEKILDDDLQLH